MVAAMEKQKRKNPTGIRMPKEITLKIKEKHDLKTDQAVVNFLFKLYEQTFFPIVVAPTLERNVEKYSQKGNNIPANQASKSVNSSGDTGKVAKEAPKLVEETPKDFICERITELELLIKKAITGATTFSSPLAKKSQIHDWKKEVAFLTERLTLKQGEGKN
jgi:hypothetical protein